MGKRSNVVELTDFGPKEARSHGNIAYEERGATEGRAMRARKVPPLETLYNRRIITKTEWDAGVRLAVSWFDAGYEKPTTVNLFGARGGQRDYTPRQLTARRDFDSAMKDLGPLTDVAYEICCLESTVRGLEENMGWRKGTGMAVLKLALKHLAVHYGYEKP
jgi:hypothetical protein